jgi:hypothetical protein
MQTNATEQKLGFARDYESGQWSMVELCERYGVTRPTGYNPGQMEVRRVSAAGTFRLKATQPFLSNALRDQYIALEETAEGVWNIVFYRTLLGRIDERSGRITGV